jgi:cytochrome c peroxidase
MDPACFDDPMPHRRIPVRAPRHRRHGWLTGFALLLTTLASACSRGGAGDVIVIDEQPALSTTRFSGTTSADEGISARILRRFAILEPDTSPRSTALIDLGRMLYYEPRLSRTGLVSCNSCHILERYGTTNTVTSIGVDGRPGTRNAPSTYNAAGHFAQFWDGRAASIEDQAKIPLENSREMDMTGAHAVAVLAGIEGYAVVFQTAFPDEAAPITLDHIAVALGAFERGLTTPGRWDRYLAGDRAALTPAEVEGARLFANVGCLVCHTGPYIGGSMFEKVGARHAWPNQEDRGRRMVTGSVADDMVFKVPSLRNVAQTAPYFHDGSVATLDEAVRVMGHHQLGFELADDEIRDLVAWLGTLTGDIPNAYIARPALPPGRRR